MNILESGISELYKARQIIIDLEETRGAEEKLIADRKEIEKQIKSLEKEIGDKKTAIIKARKKEVEASYDDQVQKITGKIKKIKDKRQKRKTLKQSERIKEETIDLKRENKEIVLSKKNIFKLDRIPRIFNTKLFFSLFKPKSILDWLVIVLAVIVAFVALPVGVYYLGFPKGETKYLIAIYFVTVIVVGGLYLLINHLVKNKHNEALQKVQELDKEIKVNKKEMKVIKKAIKKDKDESSYGLDRIDQQIKTLKLEEEALLDEKKQAILVFDKQTKAIIEDEIQKQYDERLIEIKNKSIKTNEDLNEAEDKVKVLSLELAKTYEPYMGKDLLTVDVVDELISLVEGGRANTISEAIQVRNQPNKLASQEDEGENEHL